MVDFEADPLEHHDASEDCPDAPDHTVIDIDETVEIVYRPEKRWVYTVGMADFDLPEIEARHVPVWLMGCAEDVIYSLCDYMVNSQAQIEQGQKMQFGGAYFTLREAPPMRGEEELFQAPRWCIMDLMRTCKGCGCEMEE